MPYKLIKEINEYLTADECRDIIDKFNNDNDIKPGLVYGGYSERSPKKTNKRKCGINFIELDKIENKVIATINNILSEQRFSVIKNGSLQFTKYQVGDFFEWHTDSIITANNLELTGREYTAIIQLNDDYEGGEFLYKNPDVFTINKKIGNFFVFNSSISHKVSPIKKGTRYTLVMWLALAPSHENKKTSI